MRRSTFYACVMTALLGTAAETKAFQGTCRTCVQPAYSQSYYAPQPTPPATKYQLADSTGQVWEHTDAAWLRTCVDERNKTATRERRIGGLATPEALKSPRAQPAPQPSPQYGDPYGFTAWLNGVRAQNGRGPVGHDANLSAWASANNGQQHARGMGHHVMGSARRQNSGMGAASTVWQMWMASPAHQAALLDPTITMIGIAASDSYWTFNAY